MNDLADVVDEVLTDAMNEYDPIPHWAASRLREARDRQIDGGNKK